MSSKRLSLWLADIVDNVDLAIEYLGAMNYEAFQADRKTIYAVERCLERLCEAAIRIGDERMAEIAPGTPMKHVRATGNALRHAYDRIELKAIFDTVRDDLPPLRAACAAMLEKLDNA